MTILFVVTRAVEIQASVTSSGLFRDCPCNFDCSPKDVRFTGASHVQVSQDNL